MALTIHDQETIDLLYELAELQNSSIEDVLIKILKAALVREKRNLRQRRWRAKRKAELFGPSPHL
jgi:hypothetical protein